MLKALEGATDEVKRLTVGELTTKLRAEVAQEKSLQDDAEIAVCEKFNGKYIKLHCDDSLFGEETMYIHIEDIKSGSLTDQYKRCYEIKGNVITFSRCITSSRRMKMGNVSDSKSAEELESATIITKEDYDHAMEKLKIIEGIINKMNQ